MGFSGFSLSASSILLVVTLLIPQSSAQMNGTFKCASPVKCRALVGYSPLNATTIGAVQALFAVGSLQSLLGANNLSLSTTSGLLLSANKTVRVPIPCSCANGTGVSDRVPFYTVKEGDTLYLIASAVYRGLVQFQRIGEVNNIPNYNEIKAGQRLYIPLPCSCDPLDGQDVLHYAHAVKPNSTVAEIAAEFGSNEATLLRVNGLSNNSQLLADYPFDVPLRVCNFSVKKDSLDYPLLVANGSYFVTANNCVRCNCKASNNWTLLCEPSQLKPSNWDTCPSARCEAQGNLLLSNRTTSGCSRTSCVYSGFNNQTILTSLLTESTCPAPGNYASRVQSRWNFLFVSVQLVLIWLLLLQ